MESGRKKWRTLNIPTIVFCVGWCVAFIALSTDCLDTALWEVEALNKESFVDHFRAYSAILIFPVVCVASLSVMCYVAVSWRTPRPPQLHWHGFVLILLVLESYTQIAPHCMDYQEEYVELSWLGIFTSVLTGVKRIILITLAMQKISALGPPPNRLLDIRLWGRILIIIQALQHFVVQPLPVCFRLSMWDRGFTRFEINNAGHNVVAEIFDLKPRPVELEPVDKFVVPLAIYAMMFFHALLKVFNVVYCIVATRLVWHTMAKLMAREADKSQVIKVRVVLWQHVAGLWLVLMTGIATSLAAAWHTLRMHLVLEWEKPMSPQPRAMAVVIDGVGDVVGALLLSGILSLLFKANPDGGDISGHIRGILHSAVLTSRAATVFEGRVVQTPSNLCIASFPGKYWEEWNELTWFCERGELSSACVFLPQNDPHNRFGQHVLNPGTPGQCWCHAMYGTQKPWGCAWFLAWQSNVEEAVRLNLELVVVFFPQQSGQGVVEWGNLGHSNLWDGVGLGGSQKVEVAWLKHRGYPYTAEDMATTKQRFDQQRIATTASTLAGGPSGASIVTAVSSTAPASNLWALVRTLARQFTG